MKPKEVTSKTAAIEKKDLLRASSKEVGVKNSLFSEEVPPVGFFFSPVAFFLFFL